MELNIYKQHTEMADGRKTTNEALNMPFSRASVIWHYIASRPDSTDSGYERTLNEIPNRRDI